MLLFIEANYGGEYDLIKYGLFDNIIMSHGLTKFYTKIINLKNQF